MKQYIKLTDQEKENNKKEAWNKLIEIIMERITQEGGTYAATTRSS
jgi:hypothetical protein